MVVTKNAKVYFFYKWRSVLSTATEAKILVDCSKKPSRLTDKRQFFKKNWHREPVG